MAAASNDLDCFVNPSSVAVVGASKDESSVGHALLRNLLFGGAGPRERKAGFGGPVHAVNAKGGDVLGQAAFTSLAAIGEKVDLVVAAIPPRFIPGLVDEAAAVGARGMIVISAGFGEMGDEGRKLQDDMVARAKAHGIRLIGPNCLGVLRPATALNASFSAKAAPRGRIGLLSQSGALVTGLLSYAERERFGFSAAVSLGGKADVDDEEMLRFLADDPETRAIAIYLEAFPEPRKVYEVLREVAAKKPVVAIKGGATDAGAKAASSHTGSLAGSHAAYSAAFAQAGVLQARTSSELAGWARALSSQPIAHGNRIAIITNAGGPGVLAADACGREGLALAELSADTKSALDKVLPAVWSHNNPIDVIGDATPERFEHALRIVGAAPEVDGVVLLLTVQAMTDPLATARAVERVHAEPTWTKPLVASLVGLVGTDVGSYLDERGIPELNMPEQAVNAMAALVRRGRWVARKPVDAPAMAKLPAPDLDKARRAAKEAQAAGQKNLDLGRARAVLEAAGIRYNRGGTAADEGEAVKLAESIGYPVVVKAVSADVVHKSDVGAVVLDVVGEDGVRAACAKIRQRVAQHVPHARIEGFTVDEQVKGTEIIVGTFRDPGFGPLVMVGMGGIFVEVYKDVSWRLVPLDRLDALEMIGDLQAQPLLNGARKRPVLDRAELAEVILRISNLVDAVPEIVEIDLNPLVITKSGLVAIDARVIVG